MIGIRRLSVFILLLCCISLFLFCANKTNALSGGGIDIGNPGKICIVDSLNKPVAGAIVKFIPPNRWFANVFSGKNMVSDSFLTDKNGTIALDSIIDGTYNLQVDHTYGGVFATDFHKADSPFVNNLVLKKYATVSGQISSSSGKPAQIRLAGTTYCASIDSNGSYVLTGIARESYIPVIMAADSQWTSGEKVNVTSSAINLNIEDLSFNTLLIDDFEDSGATMKIGRFLQNSHWYSNQAPNIGATVNYMVVPGGQSGTGNALQAIEIRKGAWALLGFFLGKKPDGDSLWDFSCATGLSFHAKGSGKLNVSVESDTIDKLGFCKHFSADILLQTEWRRFLIPFDSLTFKKDLNPNATIPWRENARSIKRIEFVALEGDTVQFWLDNFMVDGVDFSTIYKN
jgi:hypothetical protein